MLGTELSPGEEAPAPLVRDGSRARRAVSRLFQRLSSWLSTRGETYHVSSTLLCFREARNWCEFQGEEKGGVGRHKNREYERETILGL